MPQFLVGKRLRAPDRADNPAVPANVNPRVPFFYSVHKTEWMWNDLVGDFVPDLSRIPIDPGVRGVTSDMNPKLAKADLEGKGCVCILPNDERLGEDFMDYQVEFPHAGSNGNGNSRFVVSIFEAEGAEIFGNRVYLEKNTEAELGFKMYLVDKGIVPPLSIRARKKLIDDFRRMVQRVRRRAERAPTGSVAAEKYKAMSKKLKLMEKTLEAAQAAGAPKGEAKKLQPVGGAAAPEA